MRTNIATLGLVLVLAGVACQGASGQQAAGEPAPSQPALPLGEIDLPPGFRIDLYAEGLPDARSMAPGPDGVLFVGSRREGNLYAVIDRDQDQKADRVVTLATGMNMPNGVAYRDGALYVAEINRVLRYDDIAGHLEALPEPVVLIDTLPTDRHHGWKFIRFGPDGWLYLQVGAPCNVCEQENPRYASILRMRPDGTALEVFASGVRNTVGFDWHPITQDLWFTDNGRDMLGDDVPADELNRAPEPGLHFGFPYCHAGEVPDPDLAGSHTCDEFVPPARNLGPHVAAIGMRFYTGSMFPPEYRNQIFIAEHGSWNRSEPLGYRVMQVRLDDSGTRVASYDVFAEGWLGTGAPRSNRPNQYLGDAWGRPVDVQVMPDGALLVSDDAGGAIYRISYDAAMSSGEQVP